MTRWLLLPLLLIALAASGLVMMVMQADEQRGILGEGEKFEAALQQ